ncbi:MAG: sulfite exporter TauE/SafE family protein [Clostridia bacterium]|nr:sulfite exporter TauE/SafE family protein [Clostridia bacterium]
MAAARLRPAHSLRRRQVAPLLTGWLIPALAGAVTGVLSGFGVGGGTLLLIYMTAFAGLPQHLAQGINLLYFLPTAATALPSHIKNRYVEWRVVIPAVIAGLIGTGIAAWVATALDVDLLRRFFGLFLLYIGGTELFRKSE